MEKVELSRFTHKLTVESLAERLMQIAYATQVWLLLEDDQPQWWSVTTGYEHPFDSTDSGLTWVVSIHVGSHDCKDKGISEENAARLIDELLENLKDVYGEEDELSELLRD